MVRARGGPGRRLLGGTAQDAQGDAHGPRVGRVHLGAGHPAQALGEHPSSIDSRATCGVLATCKAGDLALELAQLRSAEDANVDGSSLPSHAIPW